MLFLKWLGIAVLVLLLAGLGYEQFSRWRLGRGSLLQRTFVCIGGQPLHFVKKGHGECTVVFVSGMGSGHAIWQELQDSVAQHAVSMAYDRNGLLFSPANGAAVSNEAVSAELEALLQQTGCPKPYILVMHSMAAVYLRPFIARHAADIRGLVFAEAAHPRQLRDASAALLQSRFVPPQWFVRAAVDLGIYRSLFSFVPLSSEIPLQHRLHAQERDYFYCSYRRLLEEVAAEAQNFDDAAAYPGFGDIPLVVLAGTSELRYQSIKDEAVKAEYRALMARLAADFLALSSNSRLIKTANSGHILQVNDNKLLLDQICLLLSQR